MTTLGRSKREMLTQWAARLGLTRALAGLPTRDCLIVINYHRVGDASRTHWDPGVFSATAAQFDSQVAWLKSRFPIVRLEEAVAFAQGHNSWRGAAVLLTFDDGYIDSYDSVFPILQAHGVAGSFFLPTSFIDTFRVPWWDALAFQVHTSRQTTLRLDYPRHVEVSLEGSRREAIQLLHTLYKDPATDPSGLIAAVEQATGVATPQAASERLFINWDEAAEMAAGGMDIGSHTHTHELISRLTAEQQIAEFQRARFILNQKLGVAADTLAFPVGARNSFSDCTAACLQQAGYRAAFSFYGGVNHLGRTEPFNICRMDGDLDEGEPMFALRTAVAAVAGRTLL